MMTAAEILYYYQKGESIGYVDNPIESLAGVRRCPYVMKRMLDQKGNLKSVCLNCGGEVILIEGWSEDSPGYGYGDFECQKCGKLSDYYGTGLKTIIQ